MKHVIQQELKTALAALKELSPLPQVTIQVDYARDKSHGNFSSNIALVLAKLLQDKPQPLAKRIVAQINCSKTTSLVEKIEIAGPGFINFYIKKTAWYPIIRQILAQAKQFGTSDMGKGEPILVEYVSANPTGPLHVGHGRGAAYGDSLVRLLKTVGYQVYSDYYVNDAGRQIDILATSVWLRYLEACGETIIFPSNAYRGSYLRDLMTLLLTQYSKRFYKPASLVFTDLPADEPQGGDKEAYIDALILKTKTLLGSADYKIILDTALRGILQDIKEDLSAFQVKFDCWFSENSLFISGFVDKTIKLLQASDHTYENSGALWFRSTAFGDDKDRVLLRENGQATYFAADAAYRLFILEKRGFKRIINVLGADHHGYITRIQAVIQALGYPAASLTALLVQFATLYRGKEKVQMSTRSGEFITLRELRAEVGSDAARFFYVSRRAEQHIDFDLALAKEQSNVNPVYYLQYAYARICSVIRQLTARELTWEKEIGMESVEQLQEEQEIELLILLTRYPEMLEQAASSYEPHIIAHYLRDLAQAFHTYYNQHSFLVEADDLRNARLNLVAATKQVIENGLNLLGVSTPEVM